MSKGSQISYDPVVFLKSCREEPAYAMRLYLHVLFHMLFFHGFGHDLEKDKWDGAADIAVENTILELNLPGLAMKRDERAHRKLKVLKEDISVLTAEKLYRYFQNNHISKAQLSEYADCFFMDTHLEWNREEEEELTVSQEQIRKLSERVRADLKSFSKDRNHSESLEQNLAQALKDKYDYAKLLQKFTVMNEDIRVNDDEFDYIYYTYGLQHYGNMPLIEPLEYKDSKKIREFVIAIDTSASCRGEIVQNFLRKTYSILTGEETFFRQMNVHIIQCDNRVQKDTKITSREEFENFLSKEKLTGFGSTDFRPVFTYVEQLKEKREFENLKGLIYFTDGYGVYPREMPSYDVMFAFLDNGDAGPEVPPWAVKVLLPYEELENTKETETERNEK
jgi:predicted metal-dependent peptidase